MAKKANSPYFDAQVQAYLDASGGSSSGRAAKGAVYAVGQASSVRAERTASARALPERIGAKAELAGLVPRRAADTSPDGHINNMWQNLSGERDPHWEPVVDEHFGHVDLVLTAGGEVKTLMVRRPSKKQLCIIDWINFSVAERTWCNTAREQLVADEQFVTEASRQLEKIFGFGVTEKCKTGKNFFKESWMLGDGMGFVCFGGNKSKMGIIISGHGCLHALSGWERRLYEFLTKVAVDPKISRVDLAHDDFDGSYLSVDWAYEQWKINQFSRKVGGRPPEIQRLGNWDKPSGRGRTLTVGMRSSSQFVRFYEKGKKEGDKESNWCRCEIEFKNTNTIISPEVLLNPSQFFKGAYPCMSYFEKFGEVDASARFEVKQRAAQITIEASEKWMSVQVGRYLRVFRELYGDKDVLDRLCCSEEDYWPKRLKRLTDSAASGSVPIHKQEPVPVPDFIHFVTTVPSYGLNGDNGFSRLHH